MITGPSIVTSGLILHLDAANPKCFVSGNTTCNSLITNSLLTGPTGNPGTGPNTPNLTNFPIYNSINGGVFDCVDGRSMNCDEDLGAHSEFTLHLWVYRNNGNDTKYITDARNDGGNWFLTNYLSYNINYGNNLTYNFGGSYNASHPDFINKWLCVTVTSDASGSSLYINGDYITGGTSLNENIGVNFRIGTRFTNSAAWTGYMGPISIYNRVLSSDEVLQNYNSIKYRYGL